MPKQQKRSYSEEQKAEALAAYAEVGSQEAARRLHIPSQTIASWARRAGIQSNASDKTRAAVERMQEIRHERRERIKSKILEKAEFMVDQIGGSTVVAVGARGATVEVPISPDGQQKLAQGARTLIETYRLEEGEATDRTESLTPDSTATFLLGARTAFDLAEERAKAQL